jgi:predicted helicase
MGERVEESITSFDELINQINNVANGIQRERGTLFEKLVLAYLQNEPVYKNLYKNVWMLKNVPEQYGIPKLDTGVDLVAELYDGSLTAVQVKFYKEGSKVGKAAIDSFVAELGKDYYQHGMIVSSTDNWDLNAKNTIEENSKHPQIIGIHDLRNSKIDWSQFDFSRPKEVALKTHKLLRDYQKEAVHNALDYYQNHNRGMMIMAPGTGKTFTSLKIAEAMAKQKQNQFRILYLVPSIQLLTQSLRGWNNDTELSITSMAVTSDRNASRARSKNEDIKGIDIGYPATTNSTQLLKNYHQVQKNEKKTDLMVVFSTYQSIEVLGEAQKNGFPEFDLIIADEAHRTTGAKKLDADSSFFTKVHSNTNVKGIKRLYQTATPKIYGDNAKKNAKDKSILLSSMDDKEKFGEVFYRLGFGQAVSHGILTDYKVMVLAVDEAAIQKDMQLTLSDPENGLNIDDVGRIVGIWNGMMRRNGYKNPKKNSSFDGAPLERAIAFTRTISESKKVSNQFENVVNDYLSDSENQNVHLSVRHADGTMNALEKGDVLDWLSNPNKPSDEARIVSNARFLTEGVDIPTLDAIIFLAPKRSQVDIVQAVGRIMRKAAGKEFGYVILPIVIPSGETPESVLDNNKNYEVVWQVINALRSVDERFEAMVDKLQIGGSPNQLGVIGVGSAPNENNDQEKNSNDGGPMIAQQTELDLQWDKFKEAIYGKIVQRVGNRKYLDNWSGDVAKIAQRQIAWIKNKLSDKNDPIRPKFKEFVISLKHNINDGIDDNQAAEMISQHLITKPIFDALFDEYDFVKRNPVSMAMEKMVKVLEAAGFAKEQAALEPLYESVKMRAEGIDDPKDKQKIIVTLYNQFFATAFKSTTERLGIVFTPIEVVDFIVKSVDFALNKYFNKSLASKDVHVLDPFTGTGTFIVRTLTYLKEQVDAGKITLSDVIYKYTNDLHANEIVLLSYYIAAINIESTFVDIDNEKETYKPFNGIVLTDTFESTEHEPTLDDSYFGTNDERLKKEQETSITAIISNPPYSVGQTDGNSKSETIVYSKLDSHIKKTYESNTDAKNTKLLYDSYIRGFRWASDRIGDNGVIGFVTNGSFIDSRITSGLRKCLYDEFNYLYIFNLRGDARTQGESRKKESGNVFGSGSRTPIAISILVKDGSSNHKLYYNDIGDYLSRNQKLKLVKNAVSINGITWDKITPDNNNDWINQRDSKYNKYPCIFKKNHDGIFISKNPGIKTHRDEWVYNFGMDSLIDNVNRFINNYNSELFRLKNYDNRYDNANKSNKFIKWSHGLKNKLKKGQFIQDFNERYLRIGMYRPFTKKYLYFSNDLVEMTRNFDDKISKDTKTIYISGDSKKIFSAFMLKGIPNVHLISSGQGLSRTNNELSTQMISDNDNINEKYCHYYKLSSDDLFYYIYAVLNDRTYIKLYDNDLKKSFPNIPLLKNKEEYVSIGRKLADLHLNYENQNSWHGVTVEISSNNHNYRVNKMKHLKKKNNNGKTIDDLSTIVFNEDITITNIPEKAYDYVVNGKPAIEWIIDQYRIKTDKKSGITDDPNEFSDDPKYILNLLLSVITVSMKTLELVDQLPKFEVIDENSN